MSNTKLNRKMNHLNIYHAPVEYELDEINWNENEIESPINTDMIPFKNSIPKNIKELVGCGNNV